MNQETPLETTEEAKKKTKKVRRRRKTAAKGTRAAASTGAPPTESEQAVKPPEVAEAVQVSIGEVAPPDTPKTKRAKSSKKRKTISKRKAKKKPSTEPQPEQVEPKKLPEGAGSVGDGDAAAKSAEPAPEQPPVQPPRPTPSRSPDSTIDRPQTADAEPTVVPGAEGHASGASPDEPDSSAVAKPRQGRGRGRRRKSAGSPVVPSQDRTVTDEPGEDSPAVASKAKPEPRRRRGGRGQRSAAGRDGDGAIDSEQSLKEVGGGVGQSKKGPRSTMLINVSTGDECRIAVIKKGRLEELFIERAASQSRVGNIYKGTVMNVEPSIQAAFIDFGIMKNGFLHISDVQPQYFPSQQREMEDVGRKIPRRSRPPIQECFQRGQEVIVQVIKEGVGTKGPTLTTYLSVPGRFLVMMPGMGRVGVSRKIEDEDARREMRELLSEMELPQGIGFILRTAGLGQSKRELQRDLKYLLRLWKQVVQRVKERAAPAELYQESDLVARTLRDVYSADFDRVIVDDADAAQRAREFLKIAMPRSKTVLELYTDREPLFHRYRIEEEIENINKRTVQLPCGGSLVIDTTEALVAIDVNSGKFRVPENAEETAFQVDMEAANEIARQLRLRDLGGLIVCDFIDLRLDRNKRAIERTLRDALKDHKERARILRMSAFGLIEMTRQRRGPSIKRNTFSECQQCKGTGLVKMPESVVLEVMRIIQLAVHKERIQRITVRVSNNVAYQILNRKRSAINVIEAETEKEIIVLGDDGFSSDEVAYDCEDARGQAVLINPVGQTDRRGRRPRR